MLAADLESAPWLSAAFAALVYAAMWALAHALTRSPVVQRAATGSTSRFGTLDGLRGVLALGVFVHHTVAASVYVVTGHWAAGGNPVLNHLGQSTVALFFMITGYLFTAKACAPGMDWRRFFTGRLARLMPLYAVVITAVFGLVLGEGGWQLHERPLRLLGEYLQWLGFVAIGRPDINGVAMSWTRMAGVNWSLQYECWFYLVGVPLLALSARLLPARPRALLVAALLLLPLGWAAYRGRIGGPPLYVAHFLCGILAAHLHADARIAPRLSHPAMRGLAALSVPALMFWPDAFSAMPLVLSLLIFLGALGGLSFFGLLRTRAALWLGDISYGIYLTHGVLLWCVLHAAGGARGLPTLPLAAWAGAMLATAAGVVLLGSLSYIMLEKPWIDRARRTPRPGVGARPPA